MINRIIFFIFFAISSIGMSPAQSQECSAKVNAVKIDDVWAGVKVGYSAVDVGQYIYIVYYDKDRWVTIAQYNKCSELILRKKLNSRFNGWDAHNYLSVVSDSQGGIHVAGNMHSSELFYSYGIVEPGLASFRSFSQMIGSDEKYTTYPIFFVLPNGRLAFSYRYGYSGDGDFVVNEYSSGNWTRLIKGLFGGGDERGSFSAYPTNFVFDDKNGVYGVAWVWRRSPLAETNFNLNYAQTKDFRTWYSLDGAEVILPFSRSKEVEIVGIPPGSGLFNNIKMTYVDGSPVISFLRYDKNGYSQVYHAIGVAGKWRVRQVTNFKYRWDFSGLGSIEELIKFSGVQRQGEKLVEFIRSPVDEGLLYSFNLENFQLEGSGALSQIKSGESSLGLPGDFDSLGGIINKFKIKEGSEYLLWKSLPEDNRDQPRTCLINGDTCGFVKPLYLVFSK